MSAALLRDQVRQDLKDELESQLGALADGASMEFGQMKHLQGMSAGLKAAQRILDERYKEMNG